MESSSWEVTSVSLVPMSNPVVSWLLGASVSVVVFVVVVVVVLVVRELSLVLVS